MANSQEEGQVFETLYMEQRRKNSFFLTIIVILAIVTVGSLAWGLGKTGAGQQTGTNADMRQGMSIQGRSPGSDGMSNPFESILTQAVEDETISQEQSEKLKTLMEAQDESKKDEE